jgi:hypothetical protein
MMRLWIGPVGELLGFGSDGTPVVGLEDGVEPMREIGGMVSGFTISDETVAPLRRLAPGNTTWEFHEAEPTWRTIATWRPMEPGEFEEGDETRP